MATSDSAWTDSPNVQSWLSTPAPEDIATAQPAPILSPHPSTAGDDVADEDADRWGAGESHDSIIDCGLASSGFLDEPERDRSSAPQHDPR